MLIIKYTKHLIKLTYKYLADDLQDNRDDL